MFKIGVLASGGGTNLQAVIDAVKSGVIKGEIVSVLSNNKSAYALERARVNGIEAVNIGRKQFSGISEYSKALASHFLERETDLIVLAGFMVILGEDFIKPFRNKIINIHPSLIPSFCGQGFYGLKVHEAVLKSGVKVTGATVHFVDENADTGPIILQKAVDVKDYDTPEILQKRVMEEAEWKILPEAIRLISQNELVIKDNIVRRKK